ncbi:hypothetical protein HRbin10_00998 [bacterium HR10]|nr:hypothetical protein HRbin10_00998 [bacterium HR10]
MSTAWLVAKKTLLRHLSDLRFIIASSLVILLMGISSLLMSQEIGERLRNDVVRRSTAVKNLEHIEVVKTPSPLAFIADGGEADLPWTVDVKPEYIDTLAFISLRRLPIEPPIDWTYIVTVIMSLVALFFSHDLVAGEKESRLLPWQFSNPVRRGTFLLGGYLGIMVSFCPVLLVGVLASLLIVLIMGAVELSLDHLIRVVFIVGLALLYVSIFILLGILMSSLSHQPVTALIGGLMVWALLVIIIPYSSGALAATLIHVPTDQQVHREIRSVRTQLARFSISSEMIRDIVEGQGSREEKQRRIDRRAIELEARYEEQRREAERRIGRVIEDYSRKRDQQISLAYRLARLSPVGVFQLATTELSNTGFSHHRNFLENAYRYRLIFKKYSDRIKRANRDQAKPRAQGSASIGGFTIHVVFERDYTDIPVDPATFPNFSDEWPPLQKSLQRVLFDIGLLGSWNILLFVMAVLRFLNYDVR